MQRQRRSRRPTPHSCTRLPHPLCRLLVAVVVVELEAAAVAVRAAVRAAVCAAVRAAVCAAVYAAV